MTDEQEPRTVDIAPREHSPSLAKSAFDDVKLVKSAAAGDMDAFEEIYQRYSRRAYWISLRMLKNASNAEDATQDIFVQLYRRIGSFRGEAAFSTWFHRLAVNQVLMFMRKRYLNREEQYPESIHFDPPAIKRGNVVDKITLQAAMRSLPAGYRNVLVLHDLEGYEHTEVGLILGCTDGTSKSQLHKARLKMRSLIGRSGVKAVRRQL